MNLKSQGCEIGDVRELGITNLRVGGVRLGFLGWTNFLLFFSLMNKRGRKKRISPFGSLGINFFGASLGISLFTGRDVCRGKVVYIWISPYKNGTHTGRLLLLNETHRKKWKTKLPRVATNLLCADTKFAAQDALRAILTLREFTEKIDPSLRKPRNHFLLKTQLRSYYASYEWASFIITLM